MSVCWPPNLKHFAISADNTADETILSTKLSIPLITAPIPNVINCDCRLDIAVVFAVVSVCTALKAVVVAYFTSQKPVVTIWSIFETTPVEYPVSIQSVIWFLLVK